MAEKHYGGIYSGSGNISGVYTKDINKSKALIIVYYIKYKIFINHQNAWKTRKKRYIWRKDRSLAMEASVFLV